MTTTAASSAPITITGLASGINTSSIVTQLVANESQINTGLQTQVTALQSQLAAWQSFNGNLISLQSAAASLNTPTLYAGVQAASSTPTVATATTQQGADAGQHTLSVSTLAASQEVLSSSFSSSTSEVGASGTVSLNGKQITIASTETLSSIASAINNAGAGVNATVLNVGTGDARLALTSSNTGTVNAISANDVSGNALESLGLVPSSNQTTNIRQLLSSNGDSVAGSIAMPSGTSPVGSQIGDASGAAPSGSFTLGTGSNAVTISGVDLNTMSLTDIANAINNQAGSSGYSAQVVASTSSGTSTSPQQLQIVSSNGVLTSSDFTDPNGILSAIGVTQTGFSDQVTTAADASFTLDNVVYTRSSNNVTDALPDTSLNLLSLGSTNISITQNTTAINTAVQSFVSAYNAVNDYINSQFAFTPNSSTETSGAAQTAPPLFGDQTLTNTQQQLADAINVSTGGLSMQSIGITVSQTGDLALNSSTLDTQLSTNSTAVSNLFGQSGSTTNSDVQYVSAGANTQATSVGYAVNITQPATRAVITGGQPSATTLTAPETLTFSGSLFPGGNIALTLSQGNTLAQTISQINNDNQLNSSIVASQDSSGDLVLSSTGYGSNQQFGVVSSVSGSGGSGILTSPLSGIGQDVQGTINGEAATGLGQALIGNSGNANTDGLELNITAPVAGDYGSVLVTNGVADGLDQLLTNITNTSTGAITNAENAINTEITTDQTQETTNNTTISNYQAQLETEFANMETSVANLQAQGTAMNAEIAGTSSSTTSTTSSTKSASTGSTSTSSSSG
jgi:flagellar hook-associated protein 2